MTLHDVGSMSNAAGPDWLALTDVVTGKLVSFHTKCCSENGDLLLLYSICLGARRLPQSGLATIAT